MVILNSIFCFLFLELVLMWTPFSMGVPGFNMLNWVFFYNKDENELGYRDNSLSVWEVSFSHNKILIIGDSFTAGNGIKKIKNRYDKVLESKLNNQHFDVKIPERNKTKYAVNILAEPGWGTCDQLLALKEFPYRPDFIVSQYYINDLEDCCYNPTDNIQSTFFPLAGKLSYTSNFLTCFFYLSGFIKIEGEELDESLNKSACKQSHFDDIDQMLDYIENLDIPFLILFVPELKSLYFDKDVLAYFNEKSKLNLLNVTENLMKVPLNKRIVNLFDAHAGKKTHKLWAENIFDYINQIETLNGFQSD